jgi:hypothetical protein
MLAGCWGGGLPESIETEKSYTFFTYSYSMQDLYPTETHTKRQATQHGCLPSLLGDANELK